MNQAYISIIIPAKNAQKTIEKCLNSILNLDYKNYEVIVIDDGSEDKTGEILEKYKDKIKIIKNNISLGPARARNMAVKVAEGQYLAFTDSDCLLDRDWLKELVKGFTQDNVAGVGGSQRVPEDESEFGKKVFKFMQKIGFITDYLHQTKGKLIPVNHNPSCNVMYKKEIFLKENGFFEGLWPGEDVELDYRLRKKGYQLFFNPFAIVYHYRPSNLKSFLKMMYRYGWAQGFLVKRYGFIRKIQYLPIFILSILILFLLLTLFDLKLTFIFLSFGLLILWIWFNLNLSLLFLAIKAGIFWNLGYLSAFKERKE